MRLDNLSRAQARKVNRSFLTIDTNAKSYEDYLQDNRLTVCRLHNSSDSFIATSLFNQTKNVYRDTKRRKELNSEFLVEYQDNFVEVEGYCHNRLFEAACIRALKNLSPEDRDLLERNADLKGRQQSTRRFIEARRRALAILVEECCL